MPLQLTNIELAVAAVMHSSKPVTLATAFPAYIRAAGFDLLLDLDMPAKYNPANPASLLEPFANGACGDALVAFERAMDKHPAAGGTYAAEIGRLREEYWRGWIGWGEPNTKTTAGAGKCGCRCKTCGMRIRQAEEVVKEAEAEKLRAEQALLEVPKRRKRKVKKVRRVKRVTSLASDASGLSSSGASTSAVLL